MLQGCRSENVQPCFDEANALGASSAPRLFDADRLKIATQRSCKRL
jgi:hypothetical protein